MYDHTFSKPANHQIRPHIKWAVSLVIAYGHFTIPQGLCGYVWVNILTLSPPSVQVLDKLAPYGCRFVDDDWSQ